MSASPGTNQEAPRRTRATPRPARCSDRRELGDHRRPAALDLDLRSGTPRGRRVRDASEMLEWLRSAGSGRTRLPSGSSRSTTLPPPACSGSSGGWSSIRDRRRRDQGRLAGPAAAARRAALATALGAPYKWAPMTATTRLLKIHIRVGRNGCAQPLGGNGAGGSRGRHREACDPAQRGGHQPEADPRRRRRDRPAGRDVIPADRRAAGPHRRDEGVPDAEEVSALRHRDREARGRGDAPLFSNRDCPSRGLETLINWTALRISTASASKTIRLLWDKGLIRTLPDLYRLTKEQLMELEGFAGDFGDPQRSSRSSARSRFRSRASCSA